MEKSGPVNGGSPYASHPGHNMSMSADESRSGLLANVRHHQQGVPLHDLRQPDVGQVEKSSPAVSLSSPRPSHGFPGRFESDPSTSPSTADNASSVTGGDGQARLDATDGAARRHSNRSHSVLSSLEESHASPTQPTHDPSVSWADQMHEMTARIHWLERTVHTLESQNHEYRIRELERHRSEYASNVAPGGQFDREREQSGPPLAQSSHALRSSSVNGGQPRSIPCQVGIKAQGDYLRTQPDDYTMFQKGSSRRG